MSPLFLNFLMNEIMNVLGKVTKVVLDEIT